MWLARNFNLNIMEQGKSSKLKESRQIFDDSMQSLLADFHRDLPVSAPSLYFPLSNRMLHVLSSSGAFGEKNKKRELSGVTDSNLSL